MAALREKGYEVTTDWSPVRIEVYHLRLSYIDIHPLVIDGDGSARQADLEGGWYEFQADWFSSTPYGVRTVSASARRRRNYFTVDTS